MKLGKLNLTCTLSYIPKRCEQAPGFKVLCYTIKQLGIKRQRLQSVHF